MTTEWRAGFARGLALAAAAVLAGLWCSGCRSSEDDYQALRAENNALSAELVTAHRENEILTRALDNIKREQETMQLLLNAGKSDLLAGRAAWPAAGARALDSADRPPNSDASDGEEWQTPETLAAARSRPAAPPAAAADGRVYLTKPGDVLSLIAAAHNTTVEKLLELNPKLRVRRNHMIYDNERLRLP